MITRFVCRICFQPAVPAFPQAHSCGSCWARWQARLNGSDLPPRKAATVAPDMDRPAPALSLANIAEHGGHCCRDCQRYVDPDISDVGQPNKCPRCDSTRLRFDPPVLGYHQPAAVA